MACTLASSAALLAGTPLARRASRPAAAATCAARPQLCQRRRGLAVRAIAEEPEPVGMAGAVQDLARAAERVFARYDFLSAFMGALAVTGYCVMKGQDVGTALWITAAATVVALLVNDLIPEEF